MFNGATISVDRIYLFLGDEDISGDTNDPLSSSAD